MGVCVCVRLTRVSRHPSTSRSSAGSSGLPSSLYRRWAVGGRVGYVRRAARASVKVGCRMMRCVPPGLGDVSRDGLQAACLLQATVMAVKERLFSGCASKMGQGAWTAQDVTDKKSLDGGYIV